jgi:hypothetical protein
MPQLFDNELDQVSDALDALTEGVAESVAAQHKPMGPDPGSDRTHTTVRLEVAAGTASV